MIWCGFGRLFLLLLWIFFLVWCWSGDWDLLIEMLIWFLVLIEMEIQRGFLDFWVSMFTRWRWWIGWCLIEDEEEVCTGWFFFSAFFEVADEEEEMSEMSILSFVYIFIYLDWWRSIDFEWWRLIGLVWTLIEDDVWLKMKKKFVLVDFFFVFFEVADEE